MVVDVVAAVEDTTVVDTEVVATVVDVAAEEEEDTTVVDTTVVVTVEAQAMEVVVAATTRATQALVAMEARVVVEAMAIVRTKAPKAPTTNTETR